MAHVKSAGRRREPTASVRAEQLRVVVALAKPAHGISQKKRIKAMRTYVVISCLVATTHALAAAPTTARPKAPLPFTSPKKVDEALRKNDPLLHLASRLIPCAGLARVTATRSC